MVKSLIYISILITITVIALIISNVYHNTTTSTISEDTTIQIVPITPAFDMDTLDKLKQRQKINVDLQKTITITPTPAGSSENSPTPSPTVENNRELTPTEGVQ